MNIYKLVINPENGIQVVTDLPPKELLKKDLYSNYIHNTIDSIRLDIDKGARTTDILSIGSLNFHGFPINKTYSDIIKKFNLHDIQFVDIVDKKLIDYQFMFFNGDLTSFLDYDKCNFILIEDFLGDITVVDSNIPKNRSAVIKSYNENFEPLTYMIPQNGYHFLPNFDITKYDVFRIGQFDLSFYISETLKDVLEYNKMTGLHFILEPLFNV